MKLLLENVVLGVEVRDFGGKLNLTLTTRNVLIPNVPLIELKSQSFVLKILTIVMLGTCAGHIVKSNHLPDCKLNLLYFFVIIFSVR